LFVSLFVLTHALPHLVGVDAEQARPHEPAEHVAKPVPDVGPAHALPHAPQLLGLPVTSTHAPLQAVWPAGHVQAPDKHEAPLAHTFPHMPQLLVSAWRSLHAAPQSERPEAHARQLLPPPLQQCAFEHDLPLPHV
jgi:hypothetical protein